jgi:hypothetical protein
MDQVERRSAIASLVLHGTLALVVFAPALTTIALRKDQDSSKPPPPPQQRLVLAPTLAPAPPPLPKLAASALPGWADSGSAPLPVDVVAPRSTDRPAAERSRGDSGEAESPVRLPRLDADALERAARFDGKAWSEKELTAEQDRLATAANFLEFRLRGEYRHSWTALRTPTAKGALFLQVRVDARGQVVDGRRLNSTGSTALDAAVDSWLRDQGSPVSLPSIAPGVPHTFKVSLW